MNIIRSNLPRWIRFHQASYRHQCLISGQLAEIIRIEERFGEQRILVELENGERAFRKEVDLAPSGGDRIWFVFFAIAVILALLIL